MAKISLVCPKCKKVLHTEDESRYLTNIYGCTISCFRCGLSLIGVDLSVCNKCLPIKKSRMNCDTKFIAMVTYEEES